MRYGALVIAGLAAACSGTGVAIEIYPPDGVAIDRVELWIAFDPCNTSDCPAGIGWTDKDRAPGNIYFLRDESLVAAEPQGDHFVLHLESTLGNRDPSWVGVVGYDKDVAKGVKVLRDVHIPATGGDRWKVYLHQADPATKDITTKPPAIDKTYRAHVWNRAPTPELAEPTGCLVYQKYNDTTMLWESEFFVPKTDPDCDGIPDTLECNDYWYRYAQPVSTCVGPTALGTSTGVCALGGTACIDGSVNSKVCVADTTNHFACLPDAFCDHCSTQIPADDCIAGAVDQGMGDGTLPYFQCTFVPNPEGVACSIEIVTFKVPMGNYTCGTPTMHYLDQPFTNPQSSVVFGSGTDQVKIDARLGNEPCQIVLSWTTGTKLGFGTEGVSFLLDVPYANNTRSLYPVHVDVDAQSIMCDTGGFVGMCQGMATSTADSTLKCPFSGP